MAFQLKSTNMVAIVYLISFLRPSTKFGNWDLFPNIYLFSEILYHFEISVGYDRPWIFAPKLMLQLLMAVQYLLQLYSDFSKLETVLHH